MARIRDIAERSGVSPTTVSHVLNNSRPVHPDTEARVRQAIAELHYTPNMLARSLRRRQTNTIGLLVSDIENPYFAELAYAVEKAAYDRGYNLVLCNTDESHAKEVRYVEVLFAKQIDGLILAPTSGDHSYLKPYMEHGARVVVVNRHAPDIEAPAVLADDEQAMYSLASRFLADGHRSFGAVTGLATVSTTADRLRGLRRALESYQLSMSDVWLCPGQSRQSGGRAAAQAFAALPERPSCVLAFNSVMHDGFLLGLAEEYPELLNSVQTGSSGVSAVARLSASARYCLRAPGYQIGQTAATLLLDFLNRAAWHTDHIIVPSTLVELHAGAQTGSQAGSQSGEPGAFVGAGNSAAAAQPAATLAA